jgi:hypothetical protein
MEELKENKIKSFELTEKKCPTDKKNERRG